MKRRNFLKGILAAGVAPAIVRAESIMRIRPLDSGLLMPGWVVNPENIGFPGMVDGIDQVEMCAIQSEQDLKRALVFRYMRRHRQKMRNCQVNMHRHILMPKDDVFVNGEREVRPTLDASEVERALQSAFEAG